MRHLARAFQRDGRDGKVQRQEISLYSYDHNEAQILERDLNETRVVVQCGTWESLPEFSRIKVVASAARSEVAPSRLALFTSVTLGIAAGDPALG